MYYYINDFIDEYSEISKGTIALFEKIDDISLTEKVHGYERSLGDIAWHISNTAPEMMNRTGMQLEVHNKTDEPITISKIIEVYKANSNQLLEAIKTWKDEDLQKEDNMYGEMWKRGMTLSILINHEVHHRAQMTVLMRQLGLQVVGLSGPTKEEMEAMMIAMKVNLKDR